MRRRWASTRVAAYHGRGRPCSTRRSSTRSKTISTSRPPSTSPAADAAVDAADVLEHLEQQNVDTTDAVLDGTTLTVLVDSAETADEVAALGATPVFEPTAEMLADYSDVRFEAADDLLGGTGWAIPAADRNGDGVRNDGNVLCSVGFNGRLKASGAPQFATAGHCLDGTAFPGLVRERARAVEAGRPGDRARRHARQPGRRFRAIRRRRRLRPHRGRPLVDAAAVRRRLGRWPRRDPRPARRSPFAARPRPSWVRSSASRGARPGGPAAPCSRSTR